MYGVNMRGVILAGGKGTRLFPLTKVTNKHLLPVGQEPMIYHPVRQMVGCGLKEILVVTSTDHMGDVVGLLGSGAEFDCEFTYRVQDEAGGIAHALKLARNFAARESILVLLGDNIFSHSLRPFVTNFQAQAGGARVALKSVKDPSRYGVAALDEHHILSIEEKPQAPQSDFAVVGAYCYDSSVWEILEQVQPSDRGELEITSVNNAYIERGNLRYDIIPGDWTDAGTIESWIEANEMLLGQQNRILD